MVELIRSDRLHGRRVVRIVRRLGRLNPKANGQEDYCRAQPFSKMAEHYLRGAAGRRFSVFETGSTTIPVFSRATTPKIGSTSGGPKITWATVSSPMKAT